MAEIVKKVVFFLSFNSFPACCVASCESESNVLFAVYFCVVREMYRCRNVAKSPRAVSIECNRVSDSRLKYACLCVSVADSRSAECSTVCCKASSMFYHSVAGLVLPIISGSSDRRQAGADVQ